MRACVLVADPEQRSVVVGLCEYILAFSLLFVGDVNEIVEKYGDDKKEMRRATHSTSPLRSPQKSWLLFFSDSTHFALFLLWIADEKRDWEGYERKGNKMFCYSFRRAGAAHICWVCVRCVFMLNLSCAVAYCANKKWESAKRNEMKQKKDK